MLQRMFKVACLATTLIGCGKFAVPAGGHDFAGSSVVLTAPSAIADGNTTVGVMVKLADGDGTPITGWNVKLSATGTNNILSQPQNASDANGDTLGGIASTSIGVKLITMTPYQGDTTVASPNNTVSITFNEPPAFLRLRGLPSAATAGQMMGANVVLVDNSNNTVTDYLGTVQFASDDNRAVLPAPYQFTAQDGGNAVIQVAFGSAGTHALTATDVANPNLTARATGIAVNAGAPQKVSVTTNGTLGVGQALSLTLNVTDAFGNLVPSFTGVVHFSSTDPNATLPGNYTFTGSNAATFSGVSFHKSGAQVVTMTQMPSGAVLGVVTLVIPPGPTTALQISGVPTSLNAGQLTNVTVKAVDTYGNITPAYLGDVLFTSTDPNMHLTPYQFVVSDNGVKTLINQLSFKSAGTQTLTATDSANSAITGTSAAVTVNVGAVAQLGMSGLPGVIGAAVNANVVVTAQDVYGNTATSYTGSVTFSSSDGAAALPANYTYLALEHGVHTFALHFGTTGAQTLRVTDRSNSGVAGQGSTTVNGGPASRVALNTITSPMAVNGVFNLVVTLYDAANNLATYTGTMGFTSTDGTATLPSNTAFTSAQQTFTVSFHTPGTQTVTVKDTVNGSLTATSNSVVVQPGPLARFTVAGFPANPNASQQGNVVVMAFDSNNNVATNYTGTVHFSSTATMASLPSNYGFQASDGGVHTFTGLSLSTAGTQSISVNDASFGVTGSQTGITVKPLGASTLTLTGPAVATAGNANTWVITAFDSLGNTATGYTGTVQFTSTDSNALLPSNHAFSASTDHGVYSFSATLNTAGNQNVTVTDMANGALSATKRVAVSPSNANSMVITGLASNGNVGVNYSPVVTVYDPFHNVATGYVGTVHFQSSDTNATLPPNTAFTAMDAGVHTFTNLLLFKTAGNQTLQAADFPGLVVKSPNVTMNVASGSGASFVVNGLASPSTACAAQNFVVQVLDAYNNTAKGYAGAVHLTSSDTNATLPGPYTYAPATDQGVHTFTGVVLKKAPASSVTVSVTDGTLTGTQTVNVNTGNANYLTVTGFPSSTQAGNVLSPTVTAYDVCSNVVTSYSGTVAFTSSDTKAALPSNTALSSGTVTVTHGVTFKTTAANANVTATDTGTSSLKGVSAGVVVGPANANYFTVTGLPSQVSAGASTAFTVTVYDVFGNQGTNYVGTVTFTSTDGLSAITPLSYMFTGADAGAHLFTGSPNGVIFRTPSTQTLTVTDTTAVAVNGNQQTTVVGATMLSAGGDANHMCITMGTNNQTKCWGNNPNGQLGNGNTISYGVSAATSGGNIPFTTPFALSSSRTAAWVTTGGSSSCAILDNNQVVCWGANNVGQLGLGNTSQVASPNTVLVLGVSASRTALRTAVQPMSQNANHACAIMDNGNITCWGYNANGQMGMGGTATALSPNITVGLTVAGAAQAVSAGLTHTCVVTSSGVVNCWGGNQWGQVGNNANSTTAVTNPTATSTVLSAYNVAAGADHTCAINGNNVYCWGNSPGNGGGAMLKVPTAVTLNANVTPLKAPQTIVAGTSFTCIVTSTKQVACWGLNNVGQLGYGDSVTRTSATAAFSPSTGRTVTALSAGTASVCALLDNGQVTCWGANAQGQLGFGDTISRTTASATSLW